MGAQAQLEAFGRGEGQAVQDSAYKIGQEQMPRGLTEPLESLRHAAAGGEAYDTSAISNAISRAGRWQADVFKGSLFPNDVKKPFLSPQAFENLLGFGMDMGTVPMVRPIGQAIKGKLEQRGAADLATSATQRALKAVEESRARVAEETKQPRFQDEDPALGPKERKAAERKAEKAAALKAATFPKGPTTVELGGVEYPVEVTGAPVWNKEGKARRSCRRVVALT